MEVMEMSGPNHAVGCQCTEMDKKCACILYPAEPDIMLVPGQPVAPPSTPFPNPVTSIVNVLHSIVY